MGQIPAEIAQSTPRTRREMTVAPGIKSARTPRKKIGKSPQWLASSMRKKLWVIAIAAETISEIGMCQ